MKTIDNNVQNIYLVRHGKPRLPYQRMYYGRVDYPLSEEGEASAEALGRALAGMKFGHVYTSALLRARQTLLLARPDLYGKALPVAELNEIDLGAWEGHTFDEVRDEWNKIYEARGRDFAHVAPPFGESFADVQKRTVPAFEKLLDRCKTGDILIVAHGGAIWTLMCHYFGLDLNDIFYYLMEYCGVHKLQRSGGFMKLVRYNWSPTL